MRIRSPETADTPQPCCSSGEPNRARAPAASTTDSRYGTAAS
ncbi:Uncharacterised protein [Mycobacterium tuberculosis]|uniref:Uncharacterized protein n=1 Tax=Mycobacterium tuberculosis TaxID=1773 RepID=A0A655J146_MYCTX|nr:Uncharacterised protein [Mycobacterium tuberculosis]COX63068.1 Uncharacterised protein [Mycobacterium tuberculosis]